MRKRRIISWILSLICAFILFHGEEWFKNVTAEKPQLYVYAPADMEEAFMRALDYSGMKHDGYKLLMTHDVSKANIVVEMGKEFDSEYTKILYSPFVVAYSSEDKNLKNMRKAGMLQDAFFNDDYKEINFNKVIEEVAGEGEWENLGVKDMGKMKVYYPAPGTKYYTDYYDFMLVTVNGGSYPKNETDLQKAMEQITCFENSDYTEGVKDFSEKVDRAGGFTENILYLIPEQEVNKIANSARKSVRLFYPTITVYANYYIKADDIGSKLVAILDQDGTFLGNFYDYIAGELYRSDWRNVLSFSASYLYGERDVYNVLHLEKDRIRPEMFLNHT